jgi:aldehyde:ferredoxin oxidoreductase
MSGKYGGYVGKILRVDMSTGRTETISTWDYVPDYIGGIGLGYKILWDETNENTTEWSPENALIFACGPCSGTPTPTAARAEVIGMAPQGYPIPWAAVSGFGGDFGPKMKFAGYDAIAIVGKAETPKYLFVSEEGVELQDGDNLWGLTSYATQDALAAKHGEDVAVVCIGPAGENRVRWATIQSRSENAAGQGGFGALMGDKKLKAIVVKPGSVKVKVANPQKLLEEVKKVSAEICPAGQHKRPIGGDDLPFSTTKEKGRYGVRHQSCAYSGCTGGANSTWDLPRYYSKVPLKYTGTGTVSGVMYCVGNCAPWLLNDDWGNTEVNVEFNKLCDQLGLNVWEMFAGMGWFWQHCQNEGKLPEIMGEKIELNKNGPAVYPKKDRWVGVQPEFAVKFIRAVAYREGEGDIWAEGTPRAADKLGLSDLSWKTHKHGYAPHWDGRHLQHIKYPVWVVSALGWATQGRDPYDQQHGYVERYTSHITEWAPYGEGQGKEGALSWFDTKTISYREACEAGAKIYGAAHANDGWDKPELGYVDKEYVATWHERRAIIKSSVPVCDRQFPFLFDSDKPDRVGDIDAEVRLFNAVVGTDWTLDDMHKACERVFNVMRAIHVRQGRTRAHDESIIPYFTQPANWADEAGPQTIDEDKFRDLLTRYYKLHGWDTAKGWPTRAKLASLGLNDVAEGLDKVGKLA